MAFDTKQTKWLVIVGESGEYYARIVRALAAMKGAHIEGNLWALSDYKKSSADDLRQRIMRKARVNDPFDQGQRRIIVTRYRTKFKKHSAQSQFGTHLNYE